jgi:hypothetical protein
MMFAAATPTFAFIKLRLFDMDKRFCYANSIFFSIAHIGMMHRTYQSIHWLYATFVQMDRQHTLMYEARSDRYL